MTTKTTPETPPTADKTQPIVLPHKAGWYWVFTCDSIQSGYDGCFRDSESWYPLWYDDTFNNDDGTFGAVQFRGEYFPLSDFVGVFGDAIIEPEWTPRR